MGTPHVIGESDASLRTEQLIAETKRILERQGFYPPQPPIFNTTMTGGKAYQRENSASGIVGVDAAPIEQVADPDGPQKVAAYEAALTAYNRMFELTFQSLKGGQS